MINLDFLSYLIEYSKTENLTKASKILHISQSALTRAMQKVEEYISVPIFDRTKNKLSLNDVGHELVRQAINVIDAEEYMRERVIAFYNQKTNLSIGSVAPGPMIKYGNLIYSMFPDKTIKSKIEEENNLIYGLKNNNYDFIFTSNEVLDPTLESKFTFTENLYITIPKSHFLSGMKNGVHFKEIDGQSFLVAENLGIWDKIVAKNLPKSKFFPQAMENLYEIINASTIPNFSTNLTLPVRAEINRISLPILDDDATMNFYITYKKQDKQKFKNILALIK